jgi:hypothetical protein
MAEVTTERTSMNALQGTVRNGQIVLDEQIELPEVIGQGQTLNIHFPWTRMERGQLYGPRLAALRRSKPGGIC